MSGLFCILPGIEDSIAGVAKIVDTQQPELKQFLGMRKTKQLFQATQYTPIVVIGKMPMLT
jgi:hypothetical protein